MKKCPCVDEGNVIIIGLVGNSCMEDVGLDVDGQVSCILVRIGLILFSE